MELRDFRQVVAESSADVVLVADSDLVCRFVSPSVTRILGWTEEQMLDVGPHHIVVEEDLPIIFGAKDRKLSGDQQPSVERVRIRTAAGGFRWMEGNAQPVSLSGEGGFDGLAITLRDVTEQVEREDRLRALATIDPQTGLYNRRGLAGYFEAFWAQVRGELRPFARLTAVWFDIDRLKVINDAFGHEMGDLGLDVVARHLADVVGEDGLAVRIGGDEFVVVVPHLPLEDVQRIAERVQAGVRANPLPGPAVAFPVTLSVGIAYSEGLSVSPAEHGHVLLAAADRAAHAGKLEGRDRIHVVRV